MSEITASKRGILRAQLTELYRRLRGRSVRAATPDRQARMAPVKDRQYLANLLLDLEQRFPVNDIKLDGTRLWPLVRMEIGRAYKRGAPSGAAGSTQTHGRKGSDFPNSSFPANTEERKALIRAHRSALPTEPDRLKDILASQRGRLAALERPDFVILSKIEKYYQRVGDRRYSPILDPVHEDLSKRGRSQVVALEPLDFPCVNEPERVNLAAHMMLSSDWPEIDSAETVEALNEIDTFVRSFEPAFSAPSSAIIGRYNRICRRSAFFKSILEALQPRAVFVSSFTGWLPAIWAARQLGIPTVDVQHGGQTAYHHANTHFSNVPREGYEFLPDYFWLWGELNRSYIGKWLPGGSLRHVPLVGGNRNIAKWYRDRDEGQLADIDVRFLDEFGGRENLVLVTLGYAVKELIPECLLQVMSQIPDITWLVRLHPNNRSEEVRNQLSADLKRRGCENFFIDLPTDVRLHTVLSICSYHVTPFSTSGREAVAFGIQTAICDPVGRQMFSDEISSGLYIYADEPEVLLECIGNGLKSDTQDATRNSGVIEVSESAVDNVLERVFAGADR